MTEVSDSALASFLGGDDGLPALQAALDLVRDALSLPPEAASGRALRALAACRAGASEDRVARLLDWREFESFCATALRACGCEVEENVRLRKPRAQIDLVARGPVYSLAVDCKHWKRDMGYASLVKCAEAQKRRSRLLRSRLDERNPIASVIMTLSESRDRFVSGAAVVPVFAFRSFLDGLPSYGEFLDLV